MYVPSSIFWTISIVLLLLVAGSLVYSIFMLTTLKGDTSSPLFAPTVAALTLSAVALAAMIGAFVAYTVIAYQRDSGWLKWLVDASVAKRTQADDALAEAKQQLKNLRTRRKDRLSKYAVHRLRGGAAKYGQLLVEAPENVEIKQLDEQIAQEEERVKEAEKTLKVAENRVESELEQIHAAKGLPPPLTASTLSTSLPPAYHPGSADLPPPIAE